MSAVPFGLLVGKVTHLESARLLFLLANAARHWSLAAAAVGGGDGHQSNRIPSRRERKKQT